MYQVGGFTFETETQAKQAEREAEGIRYIKEKTRMDDPNVVFQLYHKLLEQNIFETEVGFCFLNDLQEYLSAQPDFKEEEIQPIPVKAREVSQESAHMTQKKETNKSKGKDKDYKGAFHAALFFSIVFALVIIGMFIITILSENNTNIITYENEIVDKYEAWQQELDAREKELEQREALLQELTGN